MKKTCALYRHFDAAGKLLYVGISLNALSRTNNHSYNAPWFAQIASIKIEHFDSRALALAAECAVIKAEKPTFNIIHSTIPNTFRDYVWRRQRTDDPEGDFIEDARGEADFTDFTSWISLRDYLLGRHACRGAMKAARIVWREYEKLAAA